jgi:hypothetical protein
VINTPRTALQDCKADNFESLTYTFTASTGFTYDQFLKYTFVYSMDYDEYYTFDGALNR